MKHVMIQKMLVMNSGTAVIVTRNGPRSTMAIRASGARAGATTCVVSVKIKPLFRKKKPDTTNTRHVHTMTAQINRFDQVPGFIGLPNDEAEGCER
jgi:hypothetical protein